jgi:hypothetical protein
LERDELRVEYNRRDRFWVNDPTALQCIWKASNGKLALEEPLESFRLVERCESGLNEIPELANFGERLRRSPLRNPLQILRVECRCRELDRKDSKIECASLERASKVGR